MWGCTEVPLAGTEADVNLRHRCQCCRLMTIAFVVLMAEALLAYRSPLIALPER